MPHRPLDLRDPSAAAAFAEVPRFDLGIDGAFECGVGDLWADDPRPRAFRLRVGPFAYFAGDPAAPGAPGLVGALEPGAVVMPSAAGWEGLVRAVLGVRAVEVARWSFAADDLDGSVAPSLLRASRDAARLAPIDQAALDGGLASSLPIDLGGFRGVEDFLVRGSGTILARNGKAVGAAWSSLACARGVEASVYVAPGFRRSGYGTILAARFVADSLARVTPPHWDAANHESCLLARKVGYGRPREYRAAWVTG